MPIKSIQQRNLPAKQQGVVIIIALFVVALVATMSYVMMARLSRDTRATTLIVENASAELFAQGSVAWAIDALGANAKAQTKGALTDKMPLVSDVQTINGYRVSSTIYDMQARFNINNLTSPDTKEAFLVMLKALVPTLSAEKAKSLTDAIADWIAPVKENQMSQYYESLQPPYRPAHRAMVSISELALVKGMTPAIFAVIAPSVTALPVPTAININTAEWPVLMTIGKNMTPVLAQSIVAIRKQTPFLETSKLLEIPSLKQANITAVDTAITVTSSYFLLETNVEIENNRTVLYTLLERVAGQANAPVSILWQSKGIR